MSALVLRRFLHVLLIPARRLVRIAVSLAALTGTPLQITNIRGNR